MSFIAVIDPGRCKCGLLLVNLENTRVIHGKVLSSDCVEAQLQQWNQTSKLEQILIGDGTGSQTWESQVGRWTPSTMLIPEKGTTLRARSRYWELWPVRGWQRLLPLGMRMPPVDLDAVAALVMLEDHLGIRFTWPGEQPDFRVKTSLAR